MTAAARFLCRTCGQRSTSWSAAQRHADEHHHHRGTPIDQREHRSARRQTILSVADPEA